MPELGHAGYTGQYMEFPGKHEVAEAVQQAALAFLLTAEAATPA